MATYKAEAIVMPNGDEFVPDENVFVAEYGVTTWAEVNAAYQAGKAMYCRREMNGGTWVAMQPFVWFDDDGLGFVFISYNDDGTSFSQSYIYMNGSWGNASIEGHAYPFTASQAPTSIYGICIATQNDKIVRSSITFGSSTTKYLSNKGTWENIPVTSVNGSTGAVTGLQTTANLVTSVSSASTDSQYPSAKCLYDMVGDIETLLAAI